MLLILGGCPANLDDPQRFDDAGMVVTDPSAAPACVTAIFARTCSGMVCHDHGSSTNDLDLESPGVGMRLVDVPATFAGVMMEGGSVCMPAKYIDTSNRPASWLLVKINGMQGDCGTPMPQIGTLTSTDKTCLNSYINTVMGTSSGSGGATASGGSGGAAATAGGAGGSTAMSGGTGGMAASSGGAGGTSSGGSGGSSTASGGASGTAGTGGM
jgi:hypothetical protein